MSAPIAHGGGLAAAAQLYGGGPADWLDLSTGLNPLPPALPEIPPKIWHRLPDRDLIAAAREAARHYYRSGSILPLPAPGTQSLIQLLPKLIQGGRPVAVAAPTYGEYEHVLGAAGFRVDYVKDLSEVTPEHSLAVIVNPNNPDGRRHDTRRLIELHERMGRTGGLLVVDEAFGDSEPEISLAPLAADMPQLLIFRSFGKFFGLAGLRLGFVIGSPSLLEKLENSLGPWAVSGPALFLAKDILSQDPAPIHARIKARKAAQQRVLSSAELVIGGGTALFSLIADDRAAQLHDHLCGHHILVRKFDYAPTWLRFGLTPDEEADRRLSAALSDFDR